MSYTVVELSHLSGVSVETLNYYDEIGLLSPIQTIASANGSSLYEESHLLKLQQIMLYREEGLTVDEIRTRMGQKMDNTDMLLFHKERLLGKQFRIQVLIDTINYTIDYLKRGNQLSHQRLYDGFALSLQDQERNQAPYNNSTKPSTTEHSDEANPKWSKDDYLNTQREADRIYIDLCNALEKGEDPGSPSVQKIIKRHYEWVSHFYTPTKEIYSGLGELYVDHEDFKQLYAGYHPQLAQYLRDGMKIYAEQHM